MKEKWVRINTIEGYEDVKSCYWISNNDEDKIINKNTGKRLKCGFNKDGHKRINLRTKDNKYKACGIHTLKVKAFLYIPNPLAYNIIRHLNDVKTDNRLENLAWGITSAKKTSKPVRCIETGIIYISACEVERRIGIPNNNINCCCNGKRQTAGGFHWEYVDQIAE